MSYLPITQKLEDEKYHDDDIKPIKTSSNTELYRQIGRLFVNIICSLCCYRYMEFPLTYQAVLLMSHAYYFFESQSNLFPKYLFIKSFCNLFEIKVNPNKSNKVIAYLLESVPSNDKRCHHLDSIRGIASIVVVIYHIFTVAIVDQNYANYLSELHGLFYYMAHIGHASVELFVVLSGFILAKVYWTPKRSQDIWHLIGGRIGRFYPLHWFTACIYASVMFYKINLYEPELQKYLSAPVFFKCLSLTHMWSYYNNVHGWFNYRFVCNAPAWSLSAEWALNLVMFLIIRYLPVYWGMLYFECFAWFGYYVIRSNLYGGSYMFSLVYPFFTGIVVYMVFGKLKLKQRLLKIMMDIVCVYLILGINSFLLRDANNEYKPLGVGSWPNYQMTSYGAYLIVALDNSYFVKTLFSLKPLTYLGTISFSVYLCHDAILTLAELVVKEGCPKIDNMLAMIAFIMMIIGISSAVHFKFEKPAKKYFDTVLLKMSK